MDIKILKFLLYFETLQCVYRDYHSQTQSWRLVLLLRLMIEVILISFSIGLIAHYYSIFINKHDLMHFTLNILSSIFIIVLALCHSKKFTKLIIYIEKNHTRFSKNVIYVNNLEQMYRRSMFFNIFFIALAFLIQTSHTAIKHASVGYLTYIHMFNMVMCIMRYLTIYSMLYSFLNILSEHVKCITRSISAERGDDSSAQQEVTNFDEWTVIYMDIKICSKLINSIFGLQITICLIVTTVYFIISLYSVVYLTVHGQFLSLSTFLYIIKMLIFQAGIYFMSRSAQTAQNSVDELRRCLARLLIISLSSSNEDHKAIKTFLRLVSNCPIKTEAFGSININMSLIPTFLMVLTSYTVMALQINNVV